MRGIMADMANEKRTGEGAPRLTPYDLAFSVDLFEADHFPAVREEAEARGVATSAPERFLLLGRVGAMLRELLPEDAGPEEFERYGLLLYQAYHSWRFGRRVYVLDEELARELVGTRQVIGEWELVAPHPAGYLQLPRHLFWARIDESSPPEPVDGFFWTQVGVDDPMIPPFERLDVLFVLGMRADRPGFSTVPVGVELDAAPVGHWGDADARPEGQDFENILPGGELQNWYGLVTGLEALKLVSRIFWYAAAHAGAVEDAREAAPEVQWIRRVG